MIRNKYDKSVTKSDRIQRYIKRRTMRDDKTDRNKEKEKAGWDFKRLKNRRKRAMIQFCH